MTGKWPVEHIDHKDMNGANNRWDNLREATVFQNHWNVALTSRNKSGVKGVRWDKRSGKWLAEIRDKNKKIWLGLHDTIEAATAAYRAGALKYHGEFARVE